MVVGIALNAVTTFIMVFVGSIIFANLVPTFVTMINSTLYTAFGGMLVSFLDVLPTLAGVVQLLILALPIVYIIVQIVKAFTGRGA